MTHNIRHMRALVTGATGFIGSHLVEELLKKGYSVCCLVRKTSDLKWIEGLDLTLKCGDCLNEETLHGAVSGVDVIFHVAGLTKAPREKDFFRVNVEGTANLLSAALKSNPGLKKFIFVSSLAAVGPSPDGKPVTENTTPAPVSSYGKSKLGAEALVLRHGDRLPVTILRPPMVYGPRDRDFYVLYRIMKLGIFPYWGKSYYSLIYVDDLVRGLINAAESPASSGAVFFLSEGSIYSNDEIADAISEAMGKKHLRLNIPRGMVPLIAGLGGMLGSGIIKNRAKELSHSSWICDSSTASRVLGFTPKIKISEGVKWTANWYRIHRWL